MLACACVVFNILGYFIRVNSVNSQRTATIYYDATAASITKNDHHQTDSQKMAHECEP